MKIKIVALILIFLSLFSLIKGSNLMAQDEKPPVTVDSVNLHKYAGTWYEIARILNSFQKKCARNTTATYKLRDDGRIDVINKCIEKDGSVSESKGVAKVADTASNAKLEVSFVRILGIQLFWGDYWIIGLAMDYRYAVVGTPSRKYGWILSRTPKLSTEDMETIFKLLKKQGYNPNNFVLTEQSY